MTVYQAYFSSSYLTARQRFREKIQENSGQLLSYEIGQVAPTGEPLTIDVGRFGAANAKQVLVISSGTHGVEGFFGSAVQLALLDGRLHQCLATKEHAVVCIHAVNPYGFSHLRRVNEDNIDLNRNFMVDGADYKGADPGYASLDPMLNPQSPPVRFEFFYLRAMYNIVRYGFNSLKNSVAQGQYEFPKGLFFGGSGRSASANIIAEHLPHWIGDGQRVIHLDMHTGLGKWATYVLAAARDLPQEDRAWLLTYFGRQNLQQLSQEGVLYEIRGEFTAFCRSLFPHLQYFPLLAEFGTYPVLHVLQALRDENRATHWCEENDARLTEARQQLKETFCPRDHGWQHDVVEQGLAIIRQAITALQDS